MYAMIISGHYPKINEYDVSRNSVVSIFFNSEIDLQSINQNNIIVTDNLYKSVYGRVAWGTSNAGTPSGINNILTFTPESYYDANTTYNVFVSKYPDSVKSIDGAFVQESYRFAFTTGISSLSNNNPTYEEQLEMDLAAAIAREDWCEAARIQAILDGRANSCGCIISGIMPTLPDHLIVIDTYPKNMESDIPLENLKFIKLTFNDVMPSNSGIDYSSYINVTIKNVLE